MAAEGAVSGNGAAAVVARDVVDTVLGFARTLRHAGVTASPDRVEAMLSAVGHLDVLDPDLAARTLGAVLKYREDTDRVQAMAGGALLGE